MVFLYALDRRHPRAAAERVRGGSDLDQSDIERWTRVTLRGGPK